MNHWIANMTTDAENADGLTLPTTNVASSEQQGLMTSYVGISNTRNKRNEIGGTNKIRPQGTHKAIITSPNLG